MEPISETLRELLVRQGIANGRGETQLGRMNKGPALSTMASSGEVVADGAGGAPHRPTGLREGGERNPMGISRKGRGAVKAPPVDQEVGSVSTRKPSPANGRPVPHIVVDNSRCLTMAKLHHGAPREVMVKHLRLVVSN